jgi:hypothetical protein
MSSLPPKEAYGFLREVGNVYAGLIDLPTDQVEIDLMIASEFGERLWRSFDDYGRHTGGTHNPSVVKVGAFICFWIANLKPYAISASVMQNSGIPFQKILYVNEICGLLAARRHIVRCLAGDLTIPSWLLEKTLVPSLRYSNISISALITLFQSITDMA